MVSSRVVMGSLDTKAATRTSRVIFVTCRTSHTGSGVPNWPIGRAFLTILGYRVVVRNTRGTDTRIDMIVPNPRWNTCHAGLCDIVMERTSWAHTLIGASIHHKASRRAAFAFLGVVVPVIIRSAVLTLLDSFVPILRIGTSDTSLILCQVRFIRRTNTSPSS